MWTADWNLVRQQSKINYQHSKINVTGNTVILRILAKEGYKHSLCFLQIKPSEVMILFKIHNYFSSWRKDNPEIQMKKFLM